MSDSILSQVMKAVDEFKTRRNDISTTLKAAAEFQNMLLRREVDVLTSKIRDILYQEYKRRIKIEKSQEARLQALHETKQSLAGQIESHLEPGSDERKAFEDGSALAARDAYGPKPSGGNGLFYWLRQHVSLSSLASSLQGKQLDFVLIGLGGLLGGWLNALQSDSPQVFETNYWAEALVFGIAAAWVGVFVILGTGNPDYLRRFAIGIVCGFAGVVVLNSAEKSVGIGGTEQIALEKNKQVEQALSDALKQIPVHGLDVDDPDLLTRQIPGFETAINVVVSVVSALRSPAANSEGYAISVLLVNAIENFGERDPDAGIESLGRLRNEPRLSKALVHLIDEHRRRLEELSKIKAAQPISQPAPNSPTAKADMSSPPALGTSRELIAPNKDAPINFHVQGYVPDAGIIFVSYPGVPMMSDQDRARTEQSSSSTPAILGYVRLANRDKDAKQWSDFLFHYDDPGDIEKDLADLSPNGSDDQLKHLLKQHVLVAQTQTYLRENYPVRNPDRGLIFARQTGILLERDKVKVAEVRTFTTKQSGFSQIWLAITKAN